MKIALISMEIIPGRPDLNAAAMAERIREAKDAHAELALFPALSLSGLFLGSVWKQPSFVRDCTAYAEEIAAILPAPLRAAGSTCDPRRRRQPLPALL